MRRFSISPIKMQPTAFTFHGVVVMWGYRPIPANVVTVHRLVFKSQHQPEMACSAFPPSLPPTAHTHPLCGPGLLY
jgi:hypothetical protein